MSPSQFRSTLAGAVMAAALTPMLAVHAATISYSAGGHTTSITDSACTGTFTVSGSTLICQSAGGGGGPPPGSAPTNCTTNLSPSQLTSAGGTVTFSVSGCASATGQINYNWVRNGAYVEYGTSNASSAVTLPPNASTTTAQTTSFQVNVCDPGNGQCTGLLPAVPLTATVPVAGTINPTGGGGGGGGSGGASGPIACNGYTTTYALDFAYAGQTLKATPVFGNGDIVVARFTTPATLANNGSGGSLNGVEYGGEKALRYAVLSTTPCDFTANAEGTNVDLSFSPNVYFSSNAFAGVVLQSNTTYYWNVKNANAVGGPTCGAGSNCAIGVTLNAK